ncbi:MAG: DUF2807 domain-containing protein [Bacteroidales bacterium]|nr:DUF2807 domain-containing protein [Bacteroidales bacterium]
MKKTLVTFITLVAAVFAAKAQTVETVQEYTNFSSIEASDYFEIKLVHGTSYSAKIVADQLIAENVQVFVKGSTLNLDVDEKKYAPEVKKALKGKNAIVPVLRVEITAPSVNSIKLKDNTILTSADNVKADNVKIELSDNANIKNLTLDAQDVSIKLSNKAQGRFDIYTNSITVDASNNASANLVLNCSNVVVGTAGSSNVVVNADTKSTAVKTQGSSTVTFTGNANKIKVEGSNSSTVLADGMVVDDADIALQNSSTCEINAKDHLKVDLTGSSHLIFNGNPNIDVVKIVSSSMTRSSDTKSKKK